MATLETKKRCLQRPNMYTSTRKTPERLRNMHEKQDQMYTEDTANGAAVISARVPQTVASDLADLAETVNLTVSGLLRTLIDRALAGDMAGDCGPVERATRDELAAVGVDDSRAAIAINLARRLDVDPTSAAPITTVLRRLLDSLHDIRTARHFAPLEFIRLQRELRRAGGWQILDPTGRRFNATTDWPADSFAPVFGLQR